MGSGGRRTKGSDTYRENNFSNFKRQIHLDLLLPYIRNTLNVSFNTKVVLYMKFNFCQVLKKFIV